MHLLSNNKLLDLTGKTAIVTGGAGGIGYGVVCRLAEAGANVVIANRNIEEAYKTVTELASKGFKVKAIKTDVSVETDVKNLVSETIKVYGSIDILVNNAGIYPFALLSQLTSELFDKVIATNLKSVFLTTKYVSEQMIKQDRGGKIINITSVDALHPSIVGLSQYDASKHGVWGFTKNVALELAQHKIWVNAIAPGGINTPGVRKMQPAPKPGEVVDNTKPIPGITIPMNRMGEPDDIGKVALFLASDMSSYMTGSQIVVDGGLLLT
ncbi:MAG: SDR family NAD(P)-dependent oxidoreductase [bacterium]|nr:SDR family NAD(P)-dependent oxidoreductase [bacterium]